MAKGGIQPPSVRTLLVELIFSLGTQCGVSLQMLTPVAQSQLFPPRLADGELQRPPWQLPTSLSWLAGFPDWLGVKLQSIRAQLVLKEYDCLVGFHTHFGREILVKKKPWWLQRLILLLKTLPAMPAITFTGVRRQIVAAPTGFWPSQRLSGEGLNGFPSLRLLHVLACMTGLVSTG